MFVSKIPLDNARSEKHKMEKPQSPHIRPPQANTQPRRHRICDADLFAYSSLNAICAKMHH